MKLMVAIIRPDKLAAVQAALANWNVRLMTASEVLDCRQDQVTSEIYRGRTIKRPVPKLRLEIAVEDSDFDVVVEKVERLATSGGGCTDELFVIGVEESLRIGAWSRDRTGDPDPKQGDPGSRKPAESTRPVCV
jgi:nitrogen regulatory protein PII